MRNQAPVVAPGAPLRQQSSSSRPEFSSFNQSPTSSVARNLFPTSSSSSAQVSQNESMSYSSPQKEFLVKPQVFNPPSNLFQSNSAPARIPVPEDDSRLAQLQGLTSSLSLSKAGSDKLNSLKEQLSQSKTASLTVDDRLKQLSQMQSSSQRSQSPLRSTTSSQQQVLESQQPQRSSSPTFSSKVPSVPSESYGKSPGRFSMANLPPAPVVSTAPLVVDNKVTASASPEKFQFSQFQPTLGESKSSTALRRKLEELSQTVRNPQSIIRSSSASEPIKIPLIESTPSKKSDPVTSLNDQSSSQSKAKLSDKLDVYKKASKLRESNSQSRAFQEVDSLQSSMSRVRANSPSAMHRQSSIHVRDIVGLETGTESAEEDIVFEDPLKRHKELLQNLGLTFVKLFNDRGNETVYMHCLSKRGSQLVVEERIRSGTSLYLNDGHVIEEHEGEELNLSKKILENDIKELGSHGLFSHEGDEIVVSKKQDGLLHKTQYLVSSLESERSILESNGVISLPVIQFQDLESPDKDYVKELLNKADYKFVIYNKRAMNDSISRLVRSNNMTLELNSVETRFRNNATTAAENFNVCLLTLDTNCRYYTTNGDMKMVEECEKTRKEMFDNIRDFVVECHRVEKMIEHATSVKTIISNKTDEMIAKLKKYGVN